jgi:hypothetical protein
MMCGRNKNRITTDKHNPKNRFTSSRGRLRTSFTLGWPQLYQTGHLSGAISSMQPKKRAYRQNPKTAIMKIQFSSISWPLPLFVSMLVWMPTNGSISRQLPILQVLNKKLIFPFSPTLCMPFYIERPRCDLVEHHVAITSTPPVFETFVPFRTPSETRVLETLQSASRADYLVARARMNEEGKLSPWTVLLNREMRFERDFVRAGRLLLAGEDPTGNGGNLAGFGDQRELELLVEAGFTPLEAIHIATANGAAFLGESDRIGSLAPGKQADMVVIKRAIPHPE